ncbi:restriction endonuclease subunit S [Xenorhabdus bovienii]|uniref:restriction endonuclease subunit S n=1 Tax=Xenorhabdus bovienii TaxID=40576 RepID=UPI00237CA2B7|nr:restriction endonuclease subunit S [Xenorhabdus bovienii]MDE1482541.1 restriction endonuclease subunit S [Xenorhabdus bovienii]MDE9441625.1 restriction endonuclease subunit S [Xenorhabdus bovienii]MDE9548224.1 restriction endonuclease subunit S [Xenorhabdus bovienii]
MPKLRFNKYNKIEIKKIIEFAPLQRGYDLPVNKIESGNYPVVFSNGILKEHNQYKVKGPGIVTGRSGTIGKVTYVKNDFWPHNTSLFVTNFFDNIPKYVYYYYQHIDFSKFATGSGVPTLNRNDLHSLDVSVPEKEEQTQIANFLSSVDEKITLLNKQYDLLCQYKKGMMQKIFSQELRFKDENGGEFPEWEYGSISELITNKSKKYNPQCGIYYPCIELDCISQEDGQLLNIVDSLQQKSIKNIFKKGDVLFGKLRPYLRKYIIAPFDGVCSSEIWVLKGILIKSCFLYQFVQTDFFINLANKSTGSKMPRADWNTISSEFISYPCKEEQTKIANFLSAIDDKITAKKTELDKLKIWKQGLLQQMFV